MPPAPCLFKGRRDNDQQLAPSPNKGNFPLKGRPIVAGGGAAAYPLASQGRETSPSPSRLFSLPAHQLSGQEKPGEKSNGCAHK